MENNIRYIHTNIVARDWKKLSKFYIDVFDCKPLYPERDLSGDWIEKLTEIKDVRVRGMHLNLPGYENGPTLEIFQYEPENSRSCNTSISKQGFGHIAFHVDDVQEILKRLIDCGGKQCGEIVHNDYPELGLLTVVYTNDPEGNFIELQNWKKKDS